MVEINSEYIAVGGNRHPAAADWDPHSGLLAFGADRNIALWHPSAATHVGIHALLTGHADKVTAVKFLYLAISKQPLVLSGSVDKTIRVWRPCSDSPVEYTTATVLSEHQSTINVLSTEESLGIFVSSSADRTVKLWRLETTDDHAIRVSLIQSVAVKPEFIPLALALTRLTHDEDSLLLAVAGTKSIIQVYVGDSSESPFQLRLQSTLTGHEGWIRSLATIRLPDEDTGDVLMASASQDKYIRLWRLHQGEELPPADSSMADPLLGGYAKSLSNKAHRFQADGLKFSITFEALLLGHEDWIYTAVWHPRQKSPRLLSASADNSLAIWEKDQSSGVWVSVARLGEISGQKGSTSATGSAGGFWLGLWSPTGETVASLGRTGSWRLWNYQVDRARWSQDVAVSGHIKEVTGISWAMGGKYLLSTSSDQTTRLFAEWKTEKRSTWHEFSRPQIHGYDLNCIDSLGDSSFISGADEKLLRVFEEPGVVAHLLERLCGLARPDQKDMPVAADVPVLGLSNKATDTEPAAVADGQEAEALELEGLPRKAILELVHPPLEDHLARHTLWPEKEKLYGHGYEISAVAGSHDGRLVATASRASSQVHAVIRLFETLEWREVKPALTAHSLTVTKLQFSEDDRHLLSVGRDRQWTVFERGEKQGNAYTPLRANPKSHTRMILDASWAPLNVGRVFATASRDKSAKVWRFPTENEPHQECVCMVTMTAPHPVTAIQIRPQRIPGSFHLAMGLEDGSIQLQSLDSPTFAIKSTVVLDDRIVPSRSITQLSWRPLSASPDNDHANDSDSTPDGKSIPSMLAVASEDSSLRIYAIDGLPQ